MKDPENVIYLHTYKMLIICIVFDDSLFDQSKMIIHSSFDFHFSNN